MCRFMVYKGKNEILLSELITNPSHSILTQSFDSRLRLDRRRPHNGDGFGIGYYTSPALGPEPCIFTSTIPAWNCKNLSRLASKTTSSLIFAHVRATTEGDLSESNCHPFSYKRLMFMHNGGIGCWSRIKMRVALSLGEKWFLGVKGGTDSEWAFALFLDSLDRMGCSPDKGESEGEEGQEGRGFGHTVLRKALLKTIERINAFIADVVREERENGNRARLAEAAEDSRSLLNFAVTDGESVVCTRYVSSKTDEAASLFFSSGTSWRQSKPTDGKGGGAAEAEPGQRDYVMERRDKGSDIVLVASEPLTFERNNWVTVPTNSTLTIHNQTVMIRPIVDEFYSPDPAHERSSGFAQAKGQTVTSGRALETGKVEEAILGREAGERFDRKGLGIKDGEEEVRAAVRRLLVA